MKTTIDLRPLKMLTQEEKINRLSKFSNKDLIEEVIFLNMLIENIREKNK
jgi:hypothetical protein